MRRLKSFEQLGLSMGLEALSISSEMRVIQDLILNKGSNVIIDAPAGTGKTTFAKLLKEVGSCVMLTAVTGVAAANIGGQTISSLCGLGCYNLEDHEIIANAERSIDLLHSKILVIDEVSMLTYDQLYQIELACCAAKGRFDLNFGGITVLLMGDYCQLQPITVENDEVIALESILEDDSWLADFGFFKKRLTKIYRQEDKVSLTLLSKLRKMIYAKKIDDTVINFIKNRLGNNITDGVGVYSHFGALPDVDFQPDEYYFPTGKAPYVSLPLEFGAEYLVTRNIRKGDETYYNGKVITLDDDNINHFYVRNYRYEKQPYIENGVKKFNTVAVEIISEYLALTPLTDMTTRRVQGSTFESGVLGAEFFDVNNKVRQSSTIGYLRTLYTALGRFRNIKNVGLAA